MTGKEGGGSPRFVVERLGGLGQNVTLACREKINDAGDDLVQILMKLTSDVERFDSMVVYQRTVLEQRAVQPGAFDDDQIARWSEKLSLEVAERLSLEAAEMVASARKALAQLRGVSETAEKAWRA